MNTPKKTYTIIIGSDSFTVAAFNLAEAKRTAQVNKRHLGIRGKTIVKVCKSIC